MKKHFGLVGHPLGHTLSPFIHNRLFALSHLDADYFAFDIEPSKLDAEIPFLKKLDGFNITIPYKTQIIPFIQNLHSSAKTYGAVNTVFKGDTGFNTDAEGFLKALSLFGVTLKGNVLICGAGGVARTIAIVAAGKGCSITLGVRNPFSEKALSLQKEISENFGLDIKIKELAGIDEPFDFVINGTPVGMYPNTDASPLAKAQLKGSGFVFDTIYNPKQTLLLKYAKELGIPSLSGMSMLVMQAVKAHEHWYGATFNDSDINTLIEDCFTQLARLFKNPDNIVLCGFMGSGKSSVGRLVAEKLGRTFVDIDLYIEEKEGKKIKEIFKAKGEAYFRELESKATAELSKNKNLVIACGGGTVLNETNVNNLKENGSIYLLDVSPDTVLKRLEKDTSRPLLKDNKNEEIYKLFKKRQPLYLAAAEHIVAANLSAEKVAEEIIKTFNDKQAFKEKKL